MSRCDVSKSDTVPRVCASTRDRSRRILFPAGRRGHVRWRPGLPPAFRGFRPAARRQEAPRGDAASRQSDLGRSPQSLLPEASGRRRLCALLAGPARSAPRQAHRLAVRVGRNRGRVSVSRPGFPSRCYADAPKPRPWALCSGTWRCGPTQEAGELPRPVAHPRLGGTLTCSLQRHLPLLLWNLPGPWLRALSREGKPLRSSPSHPPVRC